ncbi:MAG: hypothetical protein O6705_08200 [Actinobacteria bacterium]|jgi:hypothetical protein|nr:hypothetical protein [Actinomycetota bacterium]
MCCFFAALVFIGPRAAILIWWLIDIDRWNAAFSNLIWPVIGFFFAPWTTLSWVIIAPGGVSGLDWVILGIGILADVASYSGSLYGNRGYASATT